MPIYIVLIINFILLDYALLFPSSFLHKTEGFFNIYTFQIAYVLLLHIAKTKDYKFANKNYVYLVGIGISLSLSIICSIWQSELIYYFIFFFTQLMAIVFMIIQQKKIYLSYIIIFVGMMYSLFIGFFDIERGSQDMIFYMFFMSLLVYLLLFFSERKKQQSLLHKESIRIIKENRKYTFFFYIFCLVSICVSNVFRGVAEYIFYGLMLYAIYPETKEIFQVNKKIHQILFLFCLLLSAVNVFWIRKGYVLNIFIFMTLFCFVAYVIWRRLEEELVFKREEIVLLESIADSSRETRISLAQPIDISYKPRNVWQSCLGFLQKKKQIHIRNGGQEIAFGYFISPKEYEDMLEFLKEYVVLVEDS